jgi:ABC-2 type transport system ATP-binding protein
LLYRYSAFVHTVSLCLFDALSIQPGLRLFAPAAITMTEAIVEGHYATRGLEAFRRPAAISIEGLSKLYFAPFSWSRKILGRPVKAPVTALHNVSFDVHAGEVFGLLGSNGAGKTTLTKIVATLIQPTNGKVSVCGFDTIAKERQVKSLIGLATAEERSSYWRLTAEQNLIFFARIYGMSDRPAKARISELIEQLELTEVARRRFGELSTGNKQRVAVARALLMNPPILLLDEPTRSLDPLAAARMRILIASLASASPPVTVLLTSHNLTEVEELCARVAVISKGRIRAIGSPSDLRSSGQSDESATLLIQGLKLAALNNCILEVDDHPEVNVEGLNVKVTFKRQTGDQKLDLAIRTIQKAGGRILSVELQTGNLLDVLERLEQEAEVDGTVS